MERERGSVQCVKKEKVEVRESVENTNKITCVGSSVCVVCERECECNEKWNA